MVYEKMTWMLVELASHNPSWIGEVAQKKARQLCQWCKENKFEAHSFGFGFDLTVVIHLDLDAEKKYAQISNFILKELGSNLKAIHLLWMMDAVNGAGNLETMTNVLDEEVIKAVKMDPVLAKLMKSYFRDPTLPNVQGITYKSQAVVIDRLLAHLEDLEAEEKALRWKAAFLEERLLQRETKRKSHYA